VDTLEAPVEPWTVKVGMAVGVIAAIVTFLWIFIASLESVGWVIGIVVGWIPAALGAAIAFFLGRHLWWFLAVLLVLAIALALHI